MHFIPNDGIENLSTLGTQYQIGSYVSFLNMESSCLTLEELQYLKAFFSFVPILTVCFAQGALENFNEVQSLGKVAWSPLFLPPQPAHLFYNQTISCQGNIKLEHTVCSC